MPFKIPKCSFEASEMGSMWWAASASREETIRRPRKVEGPSNTRIEGFPMSVPAMYESGDKSNFKIRP